MAFDDTSEYEDELDSDFIARYATGKLTIPTLDTTTRDDEDDEFEEYWLEQIAGLELGETDDANEEVTIQLTIDPKESRRIYQRRWRAGEIPPVQARSFTRSVGLKGLTEIRKKLPYYLPEVLKQKLMVKAKELGVSRRQLCISAINNFLKSPTEVKAINNKNNVFLFDEIPLTLWDDLHKYCKSAPNRLFVYHVVQQALSQLLDKE